MRYYTVVRIVCGWLVVRKMPVVVAWYINKEKRGVVMWYVGNLSLLVCMQCITLSRYSKATFFYCAATTSGLEAKVPSCSVAPFVVTSQGKRRSN